MALTTRVRKHIFNILRGAGGAVVAAGAGTTAAPYIAILLNLLIDTAKTEVDAKKAASLRRELELVHSNLALIWEKLKGLDLILGSHDIVEQLKRIEGISEEMRSRLRLLETKLTDFLEKRPVGREFEQVLEHSLSKFQQGEGEALLTQKQDVITSTGTPFAGNTVTYSQLEGTGVTGVWVSAKYTWKTHGNKSIFVIKLEFEFRGEDSEALEPSVVFCIDASGSMLKDDSVNIQGGKTTRLDAAKEAVNWVVDKLADDGQIFGQTLSLSRILRFISRGQKTQSLTARSMQAGRVGVVAFGDSATEILPLSIVNQENRKALQKKVQSIESRASTNISAGLEKSAALFASNSAPSARACILLSDGGANRGETRQDKLAEMAANVFRGVKVHTIGLGADYNETLLQAIAQQGGGQFFHIESDSLDKFFDKIINRFRNVSLEDVSIAVRAADGYQCRLSVERDGNTQNSQPISLPNMYGDRVNSCYIIAETETDGLPSQEVTVGTITLKGISSNGDVSGQLELVLRDLEQPGGDDLPPVFMAAVSAENTVKTLEAETKDANVNKCKSALLDATHNLELSPEDIKNVNLIYRIWQIISLACRGSEPNHIKQLLAKISDLSQTTMQDYESDSKHAIDCIKEIFESAKPHLHDRRVADRFLETVRKLVDWAVNSPAICDGKTDNVLKRLYLEIGKISDEYPRLKPEFDKLSDILWKWKSR